MEREDKRKFILNLSSSLLNETRLSEEELKKRLIVIGKMLNISDDEMSGMWQEIELKPRDFSDVLDGFNSKVFDSGLQDLDESLSQQSSSYSL